MNTAQKLALTYVAGMIVIDIILMIMYPLTALIVIAIAVKLLND